MPNDKVGLKTQAVQFILQVSSSPASAILILLGIVLAGCIVFAFVFPLSAFCFFVVVVVLILLLLAWAFIWKPDRLQDGKTLLGMKRLDLEYGDKKSGILPATEQSQLYQPQKLVAGRSEKAKVIEPTTKKTTSL